MNHTVGIVRHDYFKVSIGLLKKNVPHETFTVIFQFSDANSNHSRNTHKVLPYSDI